MADRELAAGKFSLKIVDGSGSNKRQDTCVFHQHAGASAKFFDQDPRLFIRIVSLGHPAQCAPDGAASPDAAFGVSSFEWIGAELRALLLAATMNAAARP